MIFIIGYPGETEKDFLDTINLIKRLNFINSYSFIFSPRPGTPAAEKKLNNLLDNKSRLKILQDILEKIQFENNKSFLTQNCEVLVENKLSKQEKYFGRDRYMTPVIFESTYCKPGDLVNVRVDSFNKKNLFGVAKLSKSKAA